MTDEADIAHQIHKAYSVKPPTDPPVETAEELSTWFDGQIKKHSTKEKFKNLSELTDALPKPKYVWDEPEPQPKMSKEEWAVLTTMKEMKEKSSFDDYVSEKILSANYVPPTISTAVTSLDDLTYEKVKAEMAKMVGASPNQVSSKVFPAEDFNYTQIFPKVPVGPKVPSKYLHPSAVQCTACGQGYASSCCQVHTPEWTDLKICQPCYETLHGPDGDPGSTVHSMKVLIADKMSKALAKIEVKQTPGMSYSEWKQVQAQKKCSACQSPGANVCCPEHTPQGSGLAVCYSCYETLHILTGPHIPKEAAYIEDQLHKAFGESKAQAWEAQQSEKEVEVKPSCLWCGDTLAAACCEEHAPQGSMVAFCKACKKILHGLWVSQTNINKQKNILKVIAETLEKAKTTQATKGLNMVEPNHPNPQVGDTSFDPQGDLMATWDGEKWVPLVSPTLDHVSVSDVSKFKKLAANYVGNYTANYNAIGANGDIAASNFTHTNDLYQKTTYFTVEQKASVLIEESGQVTLMKKTYIVDLPDGDTCVLPAGSVIRALAPGEDPNSDD